MKKEQVHNVGDIVYDTMSDSFGQIEDVIWVEPETNPQCWYGGFLYKHNGRGWSTPSYVAKDFLYAWE